MRLSLADDPHPVRDAPALTSAMPRGTANRAIVTRRAIALATVTLHLTAAFRKMSARNRDAAGMSGL